LSGLGLGRTDLLTVEQSPQYRERHRLRVDVVLAAPDLLL